MRREDETWNENKRSVLPDIEDTWASGCYRITEMEGQMKKRSRRVVKNWSWGETPQSHWLVLFLTCLHLHWGTSVWQAIMSKLFPLNIELQSCYIIQTRNVNHAGPHKAAARFMSILQIIRWLTLSVRTLHLLLFGNLTVVVDSDLLPCRFVHSSNKLLCWGRWHPRILQGMMNQ